MSVAFDVKARARAIAGEHLQLVRAHRGGARSFDAAGMARMLDLAEKRLLSSARGGVPHARAAEWFLDNSYLLHRAARQIAEDLPAGFQARLPVLASGPGAGRARIHAVATTLVADSAVDLDRSTLLDFIGRYQEVSALTIAELWAFPTMLRASVLGGIVQFLVELGVVDGSGPATVSIPIDPTAGMERAVRALRLFAEVDWKEFFQETNRVEAVLREDPSGVYAKMDFSTCDTYRKAVEELAWGTGRAEEQVARAAVDLAVSDPPTSRRGHVGHFLVGSSRATLEAALGYRPHGIERVRRAVRAWPTLSYFAVLGAGTAAVLGLVAAYSRSCGAGPLVTLVALLVSVIPATVVGTSVLRYAFARLLPPSTLPKLDFGEGITEEARTLVVIPALLGGPADVEALARRLELHFLANPDPRVSFALLTDLLDSAEPSVDDPLVPAARQAIASLNVRHASGSRRPFHLLHREPRWNPAENRSMGWERKRGKLEELNLLVRGSRATSFTVHEGDVEELQRTRFVLTVDSDTELPMGTVARLAGVLAHPLNRPELDQAGRLLSGYTIVQPRVEISPVSAGASRFARAFSGDVGFDIYSSAASDTYQDLFGAGVFVGKGLYDVDAFTRTLENRTPENAIVSHDLFEGIHGRTALATDVAVFESYPAHYAAFARRAHRWVRGDWQLLPWLLPTVPARGNARIANDLSIIDRWKIVDNLRRSLTAPATLALLLLGLVWLPGNPLAWTLLALGAWLSPVVPSLRWDRRLLGAVASRSALGLVFLANEAAVALDASARALVRVIITRRLLLQWTSAARTADDIAAKSPRAFLWREMAASPALALGAAVLIASLRPGALPIAAPLLLAWLLAAEVAGWVSRAPAPRDETLDAEARRDLRALARKTWLFFETFVGPADQWLPVDNHQEAPYLQTARRTSPTNIGMMLLSTLAAYDFGWLSATELALRLRSSLDGIDRLERHRGHLLNWYDTRTLDALLPRYVSTVDSGNLVGCLIALREGCAGVARGDVLRGESWDGLSDTVALFDRACERAASAGALRAVVATMQSAIQHARTRPGTWYAALGALCDELEPQLDRALLSMLSSRSPRLEPDELSELRTWTGRIHHQLTEMRRELSTLLPWLAWQDDAVARALALPAMLPLHRIPEECERLGSLLDEWAKTRGDAFAPTLASVRRCREALRTAKEAAMTLSSRLTDVGARAQAEIDRMEFRFLYDEHWKLFHIGYNATLDRLDDNHYDLLASEARLASYLAVVRREVPEAHWNALGRPMAHAGGTAALVSWGGTMFEYLMPSLLMRSQPGTLLAETCRAAIDAQMEWGRTHGVPWGVSESAFSRLDAHETYQYRSFGVPGLGFKRGLEDDLVIASYASVLAAANRPRAVHRNVTALTARGMMGTYGLFEALDFHPQDTAQAASGAVIRSYMAHHQGMVLVALDNALHDSVMVDRFHADASVESGEALLNERNPSNPRLDRTLVETEKPAGSQVAPTPETPPSWTSPAGLAPRAHLLSNGRMTTIVTDAGGGGLRWRGLALTMFRPDPVDTGDGLWIHVRDEETGRSSVATGASGRTTFGAHKAEYLRREDDLSLHVEVTVAGAADVEVRLVTLRNESARRRRLTLTSAAEPALLPLAEVGRHPAFAKLFLEREDLESMDGVLFSRRARGTEEAAAVLVHRLVREGSHVAFGGSYGDRATFYGRCGDVLDPAFGASSNRVGAGQDSLDPLMSVTAVVTLPPRGTVTLAFVTAVARTRTQALDLASRYGTLHAARWTFRDAELEAARRVSRAFVEPHDLPAVQRLYSALIYTEQALRAPPEILAAAKPSQARLWGRGISGDDPILVVRVHDPASPLLRRVIAAQTYLRACGVRVDLILLDDQATGYLTEASGSLGALLGELGATEQLNRHGGVYVVSRDQLEDEERRRLEASASVLLDTRDVSLETRLQAAPLRPADLPRFEPARNDDTAPGVPVCPTLVFDNGTGGFTEDGREYVVRVGPGAHAPAPWCNVLANAEMGCLVSESSLGCTWSGNSGENRLTPWHNDPVLDTPSEALYLRDEETAAVWSTTPLPAGGDAHTLVRHGAGYTHYSRESHGLQQTMTVFVAPGSVLKVVRLRVRNTLPRHRRLTATYYVEWVLGTTRAENAAHVVSELDRASGCVLATATFRGDRGDRTAFLASSREVHAVTADRTEFLGRRGDRSRPAALERWGLSGRVEAGLDPCAALQVHLDLPPGEELETCFFLGEAASREEAIAAVLAQRAPGATEASWESVGAYWDRILGAVRVATPDQAMNLVLNRWFLYQSLSARFFGRSGYYQSSGAFGFRDQLQDVLAFLYAAPELARAHILEAAAHQFEEGDVLHWWHPPTGRGVRTRCSDDLVWLPFVVSEYVRKTGDATILDEVVPFLRGDPLRHDEHDRYAQFEVSSDSATVMEHGRRALERGLTAGAHGLPLMGDGDWNDGMSRVGAEGRGESVWLAWFLIDTMNGYAALCDRAHQENDAGAWRKRSEALRTSVEAVAWDGAWYLRAFHDDGSKLGSASSVDCQIDSIAQSWAALSGAGDAERTRRALESADRLLVRGEDRLVLLLTPPFQSVIHDPGYIRAYPPGVRENGGQYTHAATWLGLAYAKRGDGDRAERIFSLLNPILHATTGEAAARYRIEPYVLAGDVYGRDPWTGRGGWSWYTGAAAWAWRLGIEGILGLTLENGELRIEPSIPRAWPGFEAWLQVGEHSVHVVVDNPDRVGRGVLEMTVDGVPTTSTVARLDRTGKRTHEVTVKLGTAGRPPGPQRAPSTSVGDPPVHRKESHDQISAPDEA